MYRIGHSGSFFRFKRANVNSVKSYMNLSNVNCYNWETWSSSFTAFLAMPQHSLDCSGPASNTGHANGLLLSMWKHTLRIHFGELD